MGVWSVHSACSGIVSVCGSLCIPIQLATPRQNEYARTGVNTGQNFGSPFNIHCPFRGLLCRGVSIIDVRASDVCLFVVMVSRSDPDLDGSSNYSVSYVRDVAAHIFGQICALGC